MTCSAALRICFLFGLLHPMVHGTANGQIVTPADSVAPPREIRLQEVVVTGYESRRPRYATAGAVEVLRSRELYRFSNESLLPALNLLPGVQMQERSPGSYRLSIRGSTLRSPYGIRNVKVYWNGLPFTDPAGNTALNLLDPRSLGRLEILKGPSGSVYGAGTGGTVLLETPTQPRNSRSAELFGQGGSFGSYRYGALSGSATEAAATQALYVRQHTEGWREHTTLDRQQVQLSQRVQLSERRELGLHGFFTKLYYELPGGLTREQFRQQPRQARPIAVQQRSSFEVHAAFAGLTHHWRLTDSLEHTLALYGSTGFIDHPFISDYERNAQLGGGGRSTLQYRTALFGRPLRVVGGAEYQRSFTASRVYDNTSGTPDSLRLDDEVSVWQALYFGQAEWQLHPATLLTAGLSLNQLRYRFWRQSAQPQLRTRDFRPVLVPRVALVQRLLPELTLQASVSSGFSPPSEPEIRTSEGSLNLDLQPERGLNYELGLRGGRGRRLQYEASVYLLELTQGIVGYSQPSGVVLFRNTGAIRQHGLEGSVEYRLGPAGAADGPSQTGAGTLFVNYAWQRGRFRQYRPSGEDLSGKALTGLPPHTLAAGADVQLRQRLRLFVSGSYTEATPLTDANTAFAAAYWLLAARLSYTHPFRQAQAELYAGADNLLNQRYSLGNDLNAFGSRYYNPAPPLSFYAGLRLRFCEAD